jgi:hypothetical protein
MTLVCRIKVNAVLSISHNTVGPLGAFAALDLSNPA